MENIREKFLGCVIGGAVGDAFGYPVEFLKLDDIYDRYGKDGIKDLEIDRLDGKSLISDDTQMTLFTIEGILNAHNSKDNITQSTFYSYERWLHTQGFMLDDGYRWLVKDKNESLIRYNELFSQRAPGNSCIYSLMYANDNKYGTLEKAVNKSKGCGGVMRVAPAGLYHLHSNEQAFQLGCELAAITHGHKTGYLSAGAFSSIIADLCNGSMIDDAIDNAIEILSDKDGNEETLAAINNAVILAKEGNPSVEKLSKLGEGWIAEEALAIAIYCALSHPNNFYEAVKLAVNHDGDSDSTGAICGNIMGVILGIGSIPKQWLKKLELVNVIENMAEELYSITSDKLKVTS